MCETKQGHVSFSKEEKMIMPCGKGSQENKDKFFALVSKVLNLPVVFETMIRPSFPRYQRKLTNVDKQKNLQRKERIRIISTEMRK